MDQVRPGVTRGSRPVGGALRPAHAGGGRATRRLRSRSLLAVVGLLLLTVGGYLLSPPGQRLIEDPANAEPVVGVDLIDIPGSEFVPSVVAVPAGTTVRWTFTDDHPHDIVFADGPASEVLGRGGEWSRTFDEPGDFPYTCTLHGRMGGRVLVTG